MENLGRVGFGDGEIIPLRSHVSCCSCAKLTVMLPCCKVSEGTDKVSLAAFKQLMMVDYNTLKPWNF